MLSLALTSFASTWMDAIKAMSDQAARTANIIDAEVIDVIDEIDNSIMSLPQAFEDASVEMGYSALSTFVPLLENIKSILNNNIVQQFSGNLAPVINFLSTMTDYLLDGIDLISNFTSLFSTLGEMFPALRSVVKVLYEKAAAWLAVNWPIALVGAAIVLVITLMSKLGITVDQVVGFIVGVVSVFVAFIWNAVVGVINAVIQFLWTSFVEPFIGIVEWIINVFNGGFDNFGDAVKNLIGQIISWFLSLGKIVTKIIDAIFGTSWTSELENLQDKVLGWGKNESAITLDRDPPLTINHFDYGKAYQFGFDLGADITNSIGNVFNNDINVESKFETSFEPTFDLSPKYNDTSNKVNVNVDVNKSDMLSSFNYNELIINHNNLNINKVNEVGNIRDTVDISSEDLKLMRELAEQQWLQNHVSLSPQISFGDTHVRQESDIDTIISRIEAFMEEQRASTIQSICNI